MKREAAKAITLTHLNRKNSPPALLDCRIKQLIASPGQIRERAIMNSFERLFWHPPEPYVPSTCTFSHDLYSAYATRERNRLALAVHVIHQLAVTCLPQAKVDYDQFEKALRERALYFRPVIDYVVVEYPVAWETDPAELEAKFHLPAGDAKHVLSVLEDYRATDWHVSFIQIEGLTSPYGPRAPLRWPEPPFRIRPAQLANNFVELMGEMPTRSVEAVPGASPLRTALTQLYRPPRV